MREGWQLQRLTHGAPGIRQGGDLRKAGLIEVIQLGFFVVFPFPELLQQVLGVAKVGFITPLFQGAASPLEAIPQLFLKPA